MIAQPPEGWTLATGSAGFNVGAAPVFGRFASGRLLFVFQNGTYWVGVVGGSHSTSGATAQEAADSAFSAATAEPGRAKRADFYARMASPERLA